jgi:hypothetical protein
MARPVRTHETSSPSTQAVYSGRSKGKNFVAEEECQLCRSMLHISQDSSVGNGQKNGAFWERIADHFNNVSTAGSRAARSLESKWGAIKHNVSKFTEIHSQDLRCSGASTSDILQEALELYKVKHPKGHSFSYLHCWYLLRDVPR